MNKFLKWVLGTIGGIIIIIAGGLIYFYTTSFKLKQWDYSSVQIAEELPDRPNILLLVAEDMSLRVRAFGDSIAITPNLDKLAGKSISYPNVFTTAGVCSPSRAGLITGMNQISMGGQHMRTANFPGGGYQTVPPPEVKAFPELLRASGYYTFNLLKEDYQFSGMRPGTGPFTIWDDEDDSNLWRNRKKDQPFFGMINFMETHESGIFSPLGNKPHSFIHFVMQLIRPAMVFSDDGKPVNANRIKLPPYYPDTPTVREDMARFYKNINAMDGVVGNILERLKEDGLDKSTIVIWTTDHGDCLPRAKRDLYDSGLRVPMIIYFPEKYRPKDIKPGTFDHRLISFIDLAPTILGLTHTKKEDYLQGVDFINDTIHRNYIYAAKDRIDEINYRQRAVRDERYKYIKSWDSVSDGHHLNFRDNIEMMREMWMLKKKGKLSPDQLKWFQPSPKERLYDIKNDPFELNNLANNLEYAHILERMRIALDDWILKIEDWSDESEELMVKKFQPNGRQETTPAPKIIRKGERITISSDVKGASLGYRINKGRWQLYTKPFRATGNTRIEAKAVRYGWKESKPVEL